MLALSTVQAYSINRINEERTQMQHAADAASGITEVRGSSLDLVFQKGVLVDWSL